MLISVVIPVYNTESLLAECIESVLAQTMRDFELLLIDDGSRDGSGAICDRFAANDGRIRVFHTQNGGVSRARNIGLDNAQGEFITFIDSDDRVEPDHLQQYIDSGIGEDGVAFTSIGEDRPSNQHSNCYIAPDASASGDTTTCMPLLTEMLRKSLFGWTCNKLFSRATIERLGLRFDPSFCICEDELFTTQYCAHITHIVTNSHITYHYRYVETSLRHSDPDPQMVIGARTLLFQLYQKLGYPEEALYITAGILFLKLRRMIREVTWSSPAADLFADQMIETWKTLHQHSKPEYHRSSSDKKRYYLAGVVCIPGSRLWTKLATQKLHL